MANADKPSGFRPIGNLQGAPYTGKVVTCAITSAYSTALFIGDAVKLNGSASAEGYPQIQQLAAGDANAFGVIVGFEADPDSLSTNYSPASTAGIAKVVPVLDTLFVVQADGAAAVTDVGNTADIVVGSGDTAYGTSAMELDSSDIGTGATLQILGLDKRPDNAFGTNADLVVRFNEHMFNGAGTAV